MIYKQIYWNESFPSNFCSSPCTDNQERPGASFPCGQSMFWSHTVWYSSSCSWLIYELSFSLPVPDNSTWAGSREEQGSCWAPEEQEQMLQRWMWGWAVHWAPDAAPSTPGSSWGTEFPLIWYAGSTWNRSLLLGVSKFTVLLPIIQRGVYFLCPSWGWEKRRGMHLDALPSWKSKSNVYTSIFHLINCPNLMYKLPYFIS